MIDPKALEALFRYTIGDFKRNKEAEEAMTYGRSKELIGDNVTELGKVETKLTDDQKRFIGQEEKKPDIESIRVNLVEDPEKKTGLASLNKKSDNVIPSQEKIDASSNVTEQQQDIEVDTVPTISQMYPRGTNLIKLYESQNKSGNPYLKAYKDPSTGKFTIGFGNIMIDGRPVSSSASCRLI